MKRFLTVTLILILGIIPLLADINTEKAMSKISRDTKTYLSGDCRAATEQEAYEGAMAVLSTQISNYMKTQYGDAPEAVYLPEMSSLYQRLDSRISDKRYRVMLYVKKSELKPMGNASNAIVLAKGENDSYEAVSITKSEPMVIKDTVTVVNVVEVPLNPIVSSLMQHKSKNEIVNALEQMGKDKKISGAAKFPITNLTDFYLVVIDQYNNVKTFIHIYEGKWTDITNGLEVYPEDYRNCSAFWFTIN